MQMALCTRAIIIYRNSSIKPLESKNFIASEGGLKKQGAFYRGGCLFIKLNTKDVMIALIFGGISIKFYESNL